MCEEAAEPLVVGDWVGDPEPIERESDWRLDRIVKVSGGGGGGGGGV